MGIGGEPTISVPASSAGRIIGYVLGGIAAAVFAGNQGLQLASEAGLRPREPVPTVPVTEYGGEEREAWRRARRAIEAIPAEQVEATRQRNNIASAVTQVANGVTEVGDDVDEISEEIREMQKAVQRMEVQLEMHNRRGG